MSFATSWVALWANQKVLRKENFLKEMLVIMPREEMCALIQHAYNIKRTSWWRVKIDLLLMLKIHCLQQWFGLSDPAMEEEIYDRTSFQRFLDIDLLNDNIPDESTILRFRHMLEENGLQDKLFELINWILEMKWIIMKTWTLVDATIIHAPSSTKNKSWKRDPEMASTKKWNNYHYGMKAHVWVDWNSWLIHTVTYTAANEHDSTQIEELLHWEEKYVSWDKAYDKHARKQEFRENWITYGILNKAGKWKKLSKKQEKHNKTWQRIKAKVEHPFQVMKCQWNYRKVRYRWLLKNWGQVVFMMWLINLFKCRKRLLAII